MALCRLIVDWVDAESPDDRLRPSSWSPVDASCSPVIQVRPPKRPNLIIRAGRAYPLMDSFLIMNAERRANVPSMPSMTPITTSQYVQGVISKPFPLASSGVTPLLSQLSSPNWISSRAGDSELHRRDPWRRSGFRGRVPEEVAPVFRQHGCALPIY